MIRSIGKRQGGFIRTIELLFATFAMMCLVTIAAQLFGSYLLEVIGSFGAAFGDLNQEYSISGWHVVQCEVFAEWAGSSFQDTPDFCDVSTDCGVRICQTPSPEVP